MPAASKYCAFPGQYAMSKSRCRICSTVALVKPGRGSWAYQAKNSSRAML